MRILISPAKTLDFDTTAPVQHASNPELLEHSCELIDQLKKLSPSDVSKLMSISEKLGVLNSNRFQQWSTPFDESNSKQAVYAFKGDVYEGLDIESMTEQQVLWANEHLRILSGLYGILKPLDRIQPYRLEMGTKFENERGKNLYAFWGELLTEKLKNELSQSSNTLINLASNEYFKAIKPKQLDANIITPVFKDWKNDRYKIISFFAKKARGMMTAFIIKNNIDNVEQIKQFDTAGYRFSDEHSTDSEWVFLRRLDS